MSNDGWIKIHRRVSDHWIWDDAQYFKAWISIIMTVNYEPKPVYIQGELIDCYRGQALLSLQNWSALFGKGWTIQRVRTFFDLLIKDGMISTEGLRKTTRVTVCKYDDYQESQQPGNTTSNMQMPQKSTRETARESNDSDILQQTKNMQKRKKITTTKEEEKKLKNKEVCVQNHIPTWRDSYEIYLRDLNQEYERLIQDENFIAQQQEFNPNLNIPLTMKKTLTNYWATEKGWKKKTSDKKLISPDWKATFINGMDMNKVYKPFAPRNGSPNVGGKSGNRPGQIMHPESEEATDALLKHYQNIENGN